MKKLRWPPVGITSQDDIADRETFRASNGPYSVVRSVIRYGSPDDHYPPAWFAIYHEPTILGVNRLLGRCRSQDKAVKLCNAHRECHDGGLFNAPKNRRKGKR